MKDGTLGKCKGSDYAREQQEEAKPYHANLFSIPNNHKLTLKKKIDRFIKIGVSKQINKSKGVTPTFIIPKINDRVRFISDFRELNKRMKGNLFQSLNIHDWLHNLDAFRYATSLYLNMGYYHITLCPVSWKLYKNGLSWGKFEN